MAVQGHNVTQDGLVGHHFKDGRYKILLITTFMPILSPSFFAVPESVLFLTIFAEASPAPKFHILPLSRDTIVMPDEESVSDGTTIGAEANAEIPQDSGPAAQASSPQGHQRLADFMAEHPANAVFRRFGSLNALNLLYYQAELTELEIDLCKVAKIDRESTDRHRQLYFRSYLLLSQGKTDSNDTASESMAQWKLILKLRSVMKEYSELGPRVSILTMTDSDRRSYHSTAYDSKNSATKRRFDELYSSLDF